jgi:hypothetical protein
VSSRRARLAWATGAAGAVLVGLYLLSASRGEEDESVAAPASAPLVERPAAVARGSAEGNAGAVVPLEPDGSNKPLVQQMMEARGVKAVPLPEIVRQRPRESRLWDEMEVEKPPPEVFTPEELEVDDGEEYRDPEWEWPEDAEPADLDQDVEPE